jgi:mRNA-degrading endonuclease RelE of RelBE toxin-antitoxin system
MKIFQMPRFKAYVKKLNRPFQQVILDAIEDICENPEAGESKTGDLQGIRVHKFMMNRQLTMIAYKLRDDSVILFQAGTHENFYKNLKKYLREIGE